MVNDLQYYLDLALQKAYDSLTQILKILLQSFSRIVVIFLPPAPSFPPGLLAPLPSPKKLSISSPYSWPPCPPKGG